MCPTRGAVGEEIDLLTSHLSKSYQEDSSLFADDAVIFNIQQALEEHEDPFITQFSDRPRLFTLLRMLECDNNVLEGILSANVNDYCLPLNESVFGSFKALFGAKTWDEFRKAQRYLLSNLKHRSQESLDRNPQLHLNVENGKRIFKDEKELDYGGTATVSRVRLTTHDNPKNGRLYACKRLTRAEGKDRKQFQLFMDELQILRKLSHPDTVGHPHMVRLVASYTDLEDFALVLDPVADRSLNEMLKKASIPLNLADSSNLRQWFGCLASALAYLHERNVRHKDIKPSNILLRDGTVYLCDFGISLDWTGSDPTTEGPYVGTPGYCAPEVRDEEGTRNDTSDIWSLGRVFCDMLTVLAGKPMTELLECIGGHLRKIYDKDRQENLHKWLSGFSLEMNIQQLIKDMMHKHKESRPNAKEVLQWFCKSNPRLIGPCCQGGSEAEETIVHVEPEATPTRQLPPVPLTPIAGDDRTPILDESVTTTLPIPQSLAQAKQQEEADKKAAEEEKKAKEEEKKAAEEQKKAEEDAKKKEEADAKAAEEEKKKQEESDKKATEDEKKQPEEDQVNGEPVVEDTESSPSLSLGRRSTTTGRPTSSAESSIGSQGLVKWSSGPVHYLELSPIHSQHRCNCVARTNRNRGKERLILCLPIVGLLIKAKQPTMETSEKCGLDKDMLYLYESHSEKSKIWFRTRRLVVSYKHESHSQWTCSSFWLPLTDINFVVEDMSLALGWSDCNQWNPGPTVNNKQSWDCIYDSEKPNNEIVLVFAEAGIAKVVETDLCTIYSELDRVKEWRMVDIVGQQRLLVADLTDNETINYRLACLATYELPFKSNFRAFILWSNLDLDIQIKSDVMFIRFDQVSTPHYYSQIKNEPWKDESKIGQCTESALVLGGYSITFPCSFDNSTFLPEGLKPTLESLTGWSICFFASDVEIRKVNTLSKTSYRDSDVILWKRCSEGQSSVRQIAQITFRHRDRRSDWDYLWRSGSVDATRKATFGSQKAAISVSDKSHGIQLDTTTMTAIEVNENGEPISKPYDNSFTKLELLFRSESDLTEFMIRYRELQQVVKSYALLRVPTNASSRLSSSSRRRDSGTAHANQRAS